MNAIKDSIKSGRTVVGTGGAPNIDVSVLAEAGYDFLLFDTQHSPWEIKQLQPSIQASASSSGSAGRSGEVSLMVEECRLREAGFCLGRRPNQPSLATPLR